VTPAGFFTVLKPSGWFSTTSRLPAGLHSLNGPSKQAAAPHLAETPAATAVPASEQQALDHADAQKTISPPQFLTPATHDHHLIRVALSVLFSAAFMYFLLWWVFFRPHPVY
jgi:hypothetical protein